MNQLHGVQTIELTDGAVAVQTIKTAVIGLVGTAPDAGAGVAASGSAGSVILASALNFTARAVGRAGNTLTVEVVVQAADHQLHVSVDGARVLIAPGTDAAGIITSTAHDVAQALNALDGCLVTVTTEGGGAGVIDVFTVQLSGGEDEPFPLNTAVPVFLGNKAKTQLGEAGSLATALGEIYDQTGALVVVVRVADSAKEDTRRASLLAGIQVLAQSKSDNGYQPRILIATGYSEDDAVGKALESMAQKLRAVAYVDCAAMATPQAVIRRRQLYGARTELLRARPGTTSASGEPVFRPGSAFAAGLRARIDYEKGWWWSKSNQTIYNITGVEQVDNFILNDPNCLANLLNQEEVSTIIRHDGFRHWGNRLCSVHPQLRFESVRRTMDVIEDSIEETMMLYMDVPLDIWLAGDIIGTINSYLRELKGLGAIFGGRAWLNKELNTAESLAAGNLWIDYDIGPKSPMEKLTLRVRINNQYAIEEFDTL